MPAKGNPGDKNFHHVENSPGFHQIGELTVGSSFYRFVWSAGGGACEGRGGTRGLICHRWPPTRSTEKVVRITLGFIATVYLGQIIDSHLI